MKDNRIHMRRWRVARSCFVILAVIISLAFFHVEAGVKDSSWAAEPERLMTVRGGDCAACHGSDDKLSEGHLDTKGMSLKQCLACHGKDDPALTNTLPLSHTHLLSGVTCKACHGDADPPEFVGIDKCVTCHDLGELVNATAGHSEANPHDSHYGPELDCDLCHHVHSESENFCNQCHDFSYVVPSPILKPGKASVGVEPAEQTEEKKSETVTENAKQEQNCLSCHGKPEYGEKFAQSAHGVLACSTCHRGIDDITAHMKKEEKPALTDCAGCHREIAGLYENDVHFLRGGMSCVDCHGDIHVRVKDEGVSKRAVIKRCTTCHDEETYSFLGHGNAVLGGNEDAAACSDCHGLHGIPAYDDTEWAQRWKREAYTIACISCHDDSELVERNDLNPFVTAGYLNTYHGKVFNLGFPEQVAGCPDCHKSHNILPQDDPRSAIHPNNLEKSCARCHKGFHQRFLSFYAHPDPDDRSNYPILYWANVFMIVLLASVFIFFWTHIALWWRKAYWEKWRQRTSVERETSSEEDVVYVRRFSWRDRIMHLLLIFSFFMLVMTGFPLKYHDAPWAVVLLGLWGGPEAAGFLHRFAAAVLWGLFLYTCWLSLRFLFPGGRVKGWTGRLFGPESLFFNLKDWEDLKGMFRWFFGKGEMPRFERWTYWEKFDFFAVFWGMFVIGLSGLILWFPEKSSYILPGWMINMAVVLHSEEAFLAAIFIFTVHFFNNHLVPNKFPLEPNIFTGRYSISALKKERPEEYERIIAENRLEELKTEPPGPLCRFASAVIGIASVLLGLLLTVLIFWAALCW